MANPEQLEILKQGVKAWNQWREAHADLTEARSIALELQAIVPDLAVPVQPVLLTGQSEFSMFVDLRRKYHWVLAMQEYRDLDDLLAALDDKIIAPAERKAQELEKR